MLGLGAGPRQRAQHVQRMPGVLRDSKEEDLGAGARMGEQGRGEMPGHVRPCWAGRGVWFALPAGSEACTGLHTLQ